jgi:predicted lipid-binding transport protein (Tim44 family)
MTRLLAILTAVVGFSMAAVDAEAASRLGGGRSIGKQRDMTQQAQPKAPAQQQQQTPATPQPQPSGMSKWLGPLAGLALGAGLAALFLNNGLAGVLAGLLVIGLIVAAVFFVFRMLRARSSPQPVQYAGAGAATGGGPVPSQPMYGGGAAPGSVAATMGMGTAARWPSGFDADEFARQAKLNFVSMQGANDRRDLATMREFLTPDLYREIEADIRAKGQTQQKTEVVTLNADVLDVATEDGLYVVSVRFSGLIRENTGEDPQAFSEVWHLEKPVRGGSGWIVSGIQQD